VLQGTFSYVLQMLRTDCDHSLCVGGLDYPSIGPEHAMLKDSGRAEYVPASDARHWIDYIAGADGRDYPAR